MTITIKKILKEINDSRIDLWRSSGYYVLQYDDGKLFETKSILCYRLYHMSLEQWVHLTKLFLEEMDEKSKSYSESC